jgi:hypothetical protein
LSPLLLAYGFTALLAFPFESVRVVRKLRSAEFYEEICKNSPPGVPEFLAGFGLLTPIIAVAGVLVAVTSSALWPVAILRRCARRLRREGKASR